VTSASPDPAQPGTAPPPGTGGGAGVVPTVRQPAEEPTARTRTSSTYVAVGLGIAVLVFLLIFILQNLENATVHYLGARFSAPVGVLMLIAAVAGGIIVLAVSLARVLQLRVRARRARHGRQQRVG
jgi:uncharacterized integral membrane protein